MYPPYPTRHATIGMACSLVSGVLCAFAFPPPALNLIAWVCLIPFLGALLLSDSLNRAALFGFVFGVGFFGVDLRWVYSTVVTHGHFHPIAGAITFTALTLILSLYTSLYGYALRYLTRNNFPFWITAPAVWVCAELLKSVLFTGFPWDLLGYSQTGSLIVMQLADITGIFGISFIVVLVNAVILNVSYAYFSQKTFDYVPILVTVVMLLSVLVYGNNRLKAYPASADSQNGLPVGVLQGNIPQKLKWDETHREATFQTYADLGERAVQKGARLLIWPETSAPVLFGVNDPDAQRPGVISQTLGVPMLVGAPVGELINGQPSYFNSALLIEPERISQRYDKMRLVPFGEYMPLSWLLPVGPGIAARELDYTAGADMVVFQVDANPKFSVLICYEAIFPEISRSAVAKGADFLVNITNDGWFGDSGAPYQHLAMAGVRAIENRVTLMRAANTGISASFDPAGRMVDHVSLNKEGYFVAQAHYRRGPMSFYTRYGDVFAQSMFGLVFAAIVYIKITGRKK